MMHNEGIIGLRYSRDNWFTCVDTAVLTDEELSSLSKYIFTELCVLAGFGHRSCEPDDEKLADLAGVSVNTLLRMYKELEARGVIAREGEVIRLIGHNASCYSEEGAL